MNLLTSFFFFWYGIVAAGFLDLFRLVCRMNNVCWFVGLDWGWVLSQNHSLYTLLKNTIHFRDELKKSKQGFIQQVLQENC